MGKCVSKQQQQQQKQQQQANQTAHLNNNNYTWSISDDYISISEGSFVFLIGHEVKYHVYITFKCLNQCVYVCVCVCISKCGKQMNTRELEREIATKSRYPSLCKYCCTYNIGLAFRIFRSFISFLDLS